jgi:hypothetical protein
MPRTAMEEALERRRAQEAPEELEEAPPPRTRRPRPMLSEGRPRDPLVPRMIGAVVPGQAAASASASMLSGAAVAAGVVAVLILAGLLLRPAAPAPGLALEAPTAAVWTPPPATLEPRATTTPAATPTAKPAPAPSPAVVQCVALPGGGADCTGGQP